ncbi:hypothetical protein GF326_01730, partial [Candidatus Bathyarchaeota archaeon]|nr:hypothetical protein [Candidatus Bathyarchaeota archaeon]
MPEAKVCLIGIVNKTMTRFNIMNNTAKEYQLDNANKTVTPADKPLL